MIYVFEGGSVVYDEATISEDQKNKAVAIVSLPEKEARNGKVAILKADKSEERVWYDYEDVPYNDEIKQLRQDLNDAVMELSLLVSMGGV